MKAVVVVVVMCLVAWGHSLPAASSPTDKPTPASEPAASPADSEDTFEEDYEEISRKLDSVCSAVCPALDCLEGEANVEKGGCDCRSCNLGELMEQHQVSERSATSTDLANDRAPGRGKRAVSLLIAGAIFVAVFAISYVIVKNESPRSVDPANEPNYNSNNEQVNFKSSSDTAKFTS